MYFMLQRLSLEQNDVTDILVNGPDTVYVEVGGKLQLTDVKFRDEEHLRHIINRANKRIILSTEPALPHVRFHGALR